ncbi:blue (type 1) copper domain-containing protein [Halococcus thailandensis JCM 13552]|uniref:Blue (Type 1) copper domain-containing protein n=1 Tax=Halococcus thailandensis JCM 13552 TaxID=1227457 RepID=M0MXX5_9EURY|nr:blue (type 1) copper domain-containing protein [Halococcus thailandensis JCM 13552]
MCRKFQSGRLEHEIGRDDRRPEIRSGDGTRFGRDDRRLEEHDRRESHRDGLRGEAPDNAAYFASGGADSEQAARENVNGGLIRSDEQYKHTFEQTGQYGYFCIPHKRSKMVGPVVIEE